MYFGTSSFCSYFTRISLQPSPYCRHRHLSPLTPASLTGCNAGPRPGKGEETGHFLKAHIWRKQQKINDRSPGLGNPLGRKHLRLQSGGSEGACTQTTNPEVEPGALGGAGHRSATAPSVLSRSVPWECRGSLVWLLVRPVETEAGARPGEPRRGAETGVCARAGTRLRTAGGSLIGVPAPQEGVSCKEVMPRKPTAP